MPGLRFAWASDRPRARPTGPPAHRPRALGCLGAYTTQTSERPCPARSKPRRPGAEGRLDWRPNVMPASDPYKTLGVSRGASDEEVRKAYRRLVQQHHPDHNAGSQDAARRFEEVQAAYTRIRELRISHAQRVQTPPRTEAPGDER